MATIISNTLALETDTECDPLGETVWHSTRHGRVKGEVISDLIGSVTITLDDEELADVIAAGTSEMDWLKDLVRDLAKVPREVTVLEWHITRDGATVTAEAARIEASSDPRDYDDREWDD